MKDLGADGELVEAGQSVEVDIPVSIVFIDGGQGQAEDTVCPLEVDTADVVVALKRIHVEEVMLDTEGLVGLQVVDNKVIAPQVWDVSVGITALVCSCIHDDVGKERVGSNVRLVEQVLMEQLKAKR